jgi:hypothetical protein
MKKAFLIACFAAACGGKQAPTPAPEPAEGPAGQSTGAPACGDDGKPTNAEQCECHGWTVVGDIGNGQVACPDGTTEVSRITYGIEGGVCCSPGATAP